jgi:hypothetical protein
VTSTESDLAYYRRAIERCMRLGERTDLAKENRLRQIASQCREALAREAGDGEVIEQLKATVSEYKNKAIDLIVAEKELGLAQAALAASERARRQLEAQASATDLHPDRFAALIRFEDLGAVLADAYGNETAIGLGTRAVVALAKRCARELGDEERLRRGKATLLELMEP